MSIAVVGFDIGYQTSYISVAKGGGVETIANEFSDRCTPVYATFLPDLRYIGTSAKQQACSNLLNTVSGCFTRLIGLNFDDPVAQYEMDMSHNKFVKLSNERIGIQVKYLNNDEVFSMEQLYAMQLTKLRHVAEQHLQTKVIDVVLNVRSFYTDTQRRSLMDACQIAGLCCVKLLNDTAAVGIAYGLYNKDLPSVDQPSRNIIFIDMGCSSLQTSVIAFNEGKMKVLATKCDNSLGGRLFDMKLLQHFSAVFAKLYKIDVSVSAKAITRLMDEVEKLRKLMNTNCTPLPINIECFMNDKDVTSKMKRSDFEELCDELYVRFQQCLKDLLVAANVSVSDVYDVEIVGGATRMSKLREIVENTYGIAPKTRLNSDEAVAKGCSLQAAILSPAFRVKEFAIVDALPYSISISYEDQTLELFSKWHSFPFSRQITLSRKENFSVTAFYTETGEEIGQYNISDVVIPDDAENAKVKVKARINMNGIFSIYQAQLMEKIEKTLDVTPSPPAVSTTTTNGSAPTAEVEETKPATTENNDAMEKDEVEPKKTDNVANNLEEKGECKPAAVVKYVTKATDIPVNANIFFTLTREQIHELVERENQMIMQDKLEHERTLAKNNVEEYVYDMRDKVRGIFKQFSSEKECDVFCKKLTETEDWLYDEGENLNKQAYIDRLNKLKTTGGDQIVYRANQFKLRTMEVELFGKAFVHAAKAVELIRSGDELYNHITEEEIQTLASDLLAKQEWFDLTLNQQQAKKMYEDPVVTAEKIKVEREALESKLKVVLSKPKPKVEPPPVTAAVDENASNGGVNNDEQNSEVKMDETEKKPADSCAQDMDID